MCSFLTTMKLPNSKWVTVYQLTFNWNSFTASIPKKQNSHWMKFSSGVDCYKLNGLFPAFAYIFKLSIQSVTLNKYWSATF